MLGDLFYRLGSAAGTLEAHLVGKGSAGNDPGSEVPVYDDDATAVHEPDSEADDDTSSAGLIAIAWILSSVFRPRSVRWSRVILAGVAATTVSDLVGRLAEPAPEAGREPFARDFDELQDRFGAGVATAAGYAALLYPRIPGPPLFKGLVFGAIEIAAAPRGGLVQMITRTPGIRFPLHRLARPVDEDAGPLSHLAFGAALGLLYRLDE